ncbi:MAG: MFS transporter [Ktedonobacteraceae bacterium]
MNSPITTPVPDTVKRKPGVLINRNFALLWLGQTISFTGDFVFDTILVLWVASTIAKGQPWAPLAVSGVVFMAALPAFIVAPIAGVLVDNWDNKRGTMLRMHCFSIVLILLLFPLTGLVPLIAGGQLLVWWKLAAIYTVALLIGSIAQFFNPAEVALLSDIVDAPERTRATGLHTLMLNLASLLGPIVGAFLYFALGVQSVLLLNILSFVVALFTILAIRIPPAGGEQAERRQPVQNGGLLRGFVDGLRFFGSNRILLTLLITGVMLEFGGTMRNTLGVFFLVQNLHAAENLYGVLGTAFGAGLILGAIIVSYLAQRIGRARTYWFSAIVLGILTIVFARQTSFVPAVVVMFCQGLINSGTEVIMIALVIQVAPRDFIGRVLSVFTLVYGLSWMISAFLTGYLASVVLHNFHAVVFGIVFGPLDTLFIAVGIMAIVSGIYAMLTLRGKM